ncbi:MAG TPA: HEAT repeat domain-containing protein, partial [Archangium sp.]
MNVTPSSQAPIPEAPSPFEAFAPPPPAPPPTQSAGFFDAMPPAPTPAPATSMDPEARSQAVLASAKSMRTFEAGPALGSPAELDPLRQELEREEGASLLVRFALHAGRLHQANPEFGGVITDKLLGVVEGLLIAEAYTPLAQLFERLEAQSREDVEARWVLESVRAALVTPSQAFRLASRLKELAPSDAAGLGRVIGLFGGDYAPLWIGLYEAMELPGSREAMHAGLSTLAGKNPKAFLARLEVKRPKRVSEFVSFLEKGRGADRQRVFKELMARPEPVRRREVLAGLAQAGTEDALKLCLQAATESDEELRIHAVQLVAKHYPDKALSVLAPLMDDSYDDRSQAERLALWRSLGASNHPDVLTAILDVLKKKPSLMNRGRIEERKLDALEGLAEMKRPEVAGLLEATWNDRSQPDPVRASAQRLLAAVQKLRVDEHVEARRWERTPSTFLDVVLDLHSLSCAARVLDVTSPVLDIGFA